MNDTQRAKMLMTYKLSVSLHNNRNRCIHKSKTLGRLLTVLCIISYFMKRPIILI